MKNSRNICNSDYSKIHEKLTKALNAIDEVRLKSESDEIRDFLLQATMDLVAVKKLIGFENLPKKGKDKENAKYVGNESVPTIMVVDDEEMVLQVTCIIISKMGFRPLAFTSSTKALEYYRSNSRDISLVLLDMIMPEMNGKELFLSMKEINSSIKAMLLSGWIDKEESTDINKIGLVDFLHKPIEKSLLEANILKALEL